MPAFNPRFNAVGLPGRLLVEVSRSRALYALFACVLAPNALGEPMRHSDALPEAPAQGEHIESTTIYPTLEDRKLGEPFLGADNKPVIWSRPLPFLAQKVIDLGFDLPNPFGIAIIPTWIQQDLRLDDLAVSIDGGEWNQIDIVDFDRPRAENSGAQLKLDAWVFPFMNVYATVGMIDGEGKVPLAVKGTDLFPNLCSIAPDSPKCKQTFRATAKPEYDGENLSVGTVLAVGWQQYFFTLPITYAWTDVDIVDTTVNALNVSPRLGFTVHTESAGILAFFAGATYLDADVDLEGELTIPTAGGSGPESVNLAFKINQRNRDQWNYLLGFNWDLSKCWSVGAEAGFGGSRDNIIAALTYRY